MCVQRQSLLSQLESKLELIFDKFGLEVTVVQEEYQANKDTPVIGRNSPPVAGAIAWSRHLLDRLQVPMSMFQEHESVRHDLCIFCTNSIIHFRDNTIQTKFLDSAVSMPCMCCVSPSPFLIWHTYFCVQILVAPSSKKIIKSYNKVVKTLVAFEYVWYDAWVRQVDRARSGLQATLLVRHPTTKRVHVNFDPGAFHHADAKCG